MPAKNALKSYSENSYYHLYNRGINKEPIFHDEQDYSVFLSYLKTYLTAKDEKELTAIIANPTIGWREKDQAIKLLRLNNFSDEITLLSHILMPNHFHLLVKQKSEDGIDKFMRSLGSRYTSFLNRKYKRFGPVCQAVYKAVLIESDEQLLYLSSYIHRNSIPKKKLASQGESLQTWIYKQPSSLPEYLGLRSTDWLHPEEILAHFSKTNPNLNYQSFIEQTYDYSLIQKALLDIDE